MRRRRAALCREHEGLLVEWALASRRLLRWTVGVGTAQSALVFGLSGCLVVWQAGRLADAGAALLLAYWVLQVPLLGEEIGLLVRQYPTHRNVTLRLLEPLSAPEEGERKAESSAAQY